jgi:sugar phosphate isomerase/epimerase
MHSRLTILSRVLERSGTLEHDLEQLAGGGAERVGLAPRQLLEGGLDASLETLRRSRIEITHLGHGPFVPIAEPTRYDRARAALRRSLDLAAAVDARCVYGPAGGAPALEWEDAAAAFARAIAPAAQHARAAGVGLLLEPTISLFADVSMLQTLHDTVDLAERCGVGICLDIQHCWTERNLRDAIRRAIPLTGLVQLSDWVPGNRHHFRAVPGDGVIPLTRIVGWILEAGYTGLFDLEVYAEPGIAAGETIARAIERGEALLARLGA